MPSIDWNKQTWDDAYDWSERGDEWSASWGGPAMQWYGSILPRIQAFVPTGTILEIGPGFGRWTYYLEGLCRNLILVDLSEACIDACRRRFASSSYVSYHVTDGKSLEMVPDGSVDLAFSFDSLVHAEEDVLDSYLRQLRSKLSKDGVGFIHHSNLADYAVYFSLLRRAKVFLRRRKARVENETEAVAAPRGRERAPRWLARLPFVEEGGNRALSVSAARFEKLAERAGLRCIGQEIVNWGGKRLIDCFSLFTRPDSKWARPNVVWRNPGLTRNRSELLELSRLYGADSFRASGRAR